MANFYYSASQNLIYWASLKTEYENNQDWPDDALELTDNQAAEFLNTPPDGKIMAPGDNGLPAWVDVPPPTSEEIIADAENKKQSLIDQANAFMNSKQWPGKAAIGRLNRDELERYKLWLDYLDSLEAVDTSEPQKISWPEPPED